LEGQIPGATQACSKKDISNGTKIHKENECIQIAPSSYKDKIIKNQVEESSFVVYQKEKSLERLSQAQYSRDSKTEPETRRQDPRGVQGTTGQKIPLLEKIPEI